MMILAALVNIDGKDVIMTDSPFRIVWLPVNQAWLVMFGDSRLAGPYNTRADAETYLQDLERNDDV